MTLEARKTVPIITKLKDKNHTFLQKLVITQDISSRSRTYLILKTLATHSHDLKNQRNGKEKGENFKRIAAGAGALAKSGGNLVTQKEFRFGNRQYWKNKMLKNLLVTSQNFQPTFSFNQWS